MIALAGLHASRAVADRHARTAALRSLLFAGGLIFASAATAQVGVAASVFSDDRFRGYSLSDRRPVGILDISYDAAGGWYAAASASMVATRRDGLQPLGLQLNGGYAKRLSSNLTLDLGVVHSNYSQYSSRGPAKSYSEAYAGLAGKFLSGRIYVSPDYLRSGTWTAYGEVDGNIPAANKLRFIGHVGVLFPLENRDYETYRPELDWKLGIARDFGHVTANVAWTGVRGSRDLDQDRYRRRGALVFGLTYAL